MPTFSRTDIVDALPAQIFAVLDNVEVTPSWLARCTKLERLSPGPTEVGTKLKYHYKDGSRTGRMDGMVLERVVNRRLTHTFSDKMMDVTVDFALESIAAEADHGEQTRLTHTITIDTKGIGKLFGPMIKRQLPGQTTGAMSALKNLVEG